LLNQIANTQLLKHLSGGAHTHRRRVLFVCPNSDPSITAPGLHSQVTLTATGTTNGVLSIDIHIQVPRVDYEKLSGDRLGETSEAVRVNVWWARERQRMRVSRTTMQCNGDMGPAVVWQYGVIDDSSKC
jgi:hypothetical protein